MSSTEYKSNLANDSTPHSWNDKEYKYKVENLPLAAKVNKLDQYVFVVCVWISEY